MCAFRSITGQTLDAFLSGSRRPSASHKGIHRKIYRELVACEAAAHDDRMRKRLGESGLAWDPLCDNLRRLPSSLPQAHR
eukprot:9547236-Karenia_brevis.AAC.1